MKETRKAEAVRAQSNARLIAAAPELLKELRRLVYAIDEVENIRNTFTTENLIELSNAEDESRIAIAKAEGRAE